MSYEGYSQCICLNGHYFDCGVFYPGMEKEERCPHCSAKIAWYNSVDDTNCDDAGMIPFEVLEKLFSISPGRVETCSLGHTHIVQQEIFRIPLRSETDPLRTYGALDGQG